MLAGTLPRPKKQIQNKWIIKVHTAKLKKVSQPSDISSISSAESHLKR